MGEIVVEAFDFAEDFGAIWGAVEDDVLCGRVAIDGAAGSGEHDPRGGHLAWEVGGSDGYGVGFESEERGGYQ